MQDTVSSVPPINDNDSKDPIWRLFFTQPGAAIRWFLNAPLIQSIINHPLVKQYITVRPIYILCTLGALTLLGADIWLVLYGEPGSTWSELMRTYGQRHVILPWLCGVLVGHLFHHKDDLQPLGGKLSSTEAFNLIFWISAIILGFGLVVNWGNYNVPEVLMTIVAALGVATGYILWPIHRETNGWTW